eukprot:1687261-Amphidinium_carterae.1
MWVKILEDSQKRGGVCPMRELAQVKLPLGSDAMLDPPMVVCVNPRDPIRQGPIDAKLKLFAAEYMNHPIRSSQVPGKSKSAADGARSLP